MIDLRLIILAMLLGIIFYTALYMVLNAMAVKYQSYEIKMKWSLATVLLSSILGLGLWILEFQFWGIFIVVGVGISMIFDQYVLDPHTKRIISDYQVEKAVDQIESQAEEIRGLMNDE